MSRAIAIVSATQIVTSDSHPEGIFSIVSGFPKVFDSGVDGDIEHSGRASERSRRFSLNPNPNRSRNPNPKSLKRDNLSRVKGHLNQRGRAAQKWYNSLLELSSERCLPSL